MIKYIRLWSGSTQIYHLAVNLHPPPFDEDANVAPDHLH